MTRSSRRARAITSGRWRAIQRSFGRTEIGLTALPLIAAICVAIRASQVPPPRRARGGRARSRPRRAAGHRSSRSTKPLSCPDSPTPAIGSAPIDPATISRVAATTAVHQSSGDCSDQWIAGDLRRIGASWPWRGRCRPPTAPAPSPPTCRCRCRGSDPPSRSGFAGEEAARVVDEEHRQLGLGEPFVDAVAGGTGSARSRGPVRRHRRASSSGGRGRCRSGGAGRSRHRSCRGSARHGATPARTSPCRSSRSRDRRRARAIRLCSRSVGDCGPCG